MGNNKLLISDDPPGGTNSIAGNYQSLYKRSLEDPDSFWGELAETKLSWNKKWDSVSNCNFEEPRIEWFKGAELNVSFNCLDRHLSDRSDKTAIIWEPDNPEVEEAKHISYRELYLEVNKFASALRSLGIEKGDRVCIYMPMIPEVAVAMLACARIGAIHSVVFAGFSAEALHSRAVDADCKLIVTADEGFRGGKRIPLKETVDSAIALGIETLESVVVVTRTGASVNMEEGRDFRYEELMRTSWSYCAPVMVEANDPLFILYTSGSTGKPKGVVHGSGGYLLYSAFSHKVTFDYRDEDIYWCTADMGWITGHSYVVYGPLANGATTLMFEGIPNYPDWGRFGEIVDKHRVSILYTAPTAIRAIQAQGDHWLEKSSRESLRILGSAGEPINPEAWSWYHEKFGLGQCQLLDTWWQTETGGQMITPLPGGTNPKPGCATRPFFGVEPIVVDDKGNEIEGPCEGILCIKSSWPGQMVTVFGDHERFKQTYFSAFKGLYFSGDGCRRDEDGDYWITGRVDDIINVSGHRMATAEVESALALHESVSEAAVVGAPHKVKGEGIYAYVTLSQGTEPTETLRNELIALCVKEIGPIARPDAIQWAPGLPKTRSGKIMRRILRKISSMEFEALGDVSTLADSSVVNQLIEERKGIDL